MFCEYFANLSRSTQRDFDRCYFIHRYLWHNFLTNSFVERLQNSVLVSSKFHCWFIAFCLHHYLDKSYIVGWMVISLTNFLYSAKYDINLYIVVRSQESGTFFVFYVILWVTISDKFWWCEKWIYNCLLELLNECSMNV